MVMPDEYRHTTAIAPTIEASPSSPPAPSEIKSVPEIEPPTPLLDVAPDVAPDVARSGSQSIIALHGARDIESRVDPWSSLHVNSCLGRAIRVDGRMVFTGEGYEATSDVGPRNEYVGTDAEDLVAFPPQFPLNSGGGLLGRLSTMLSPRFADRHFERRYQEHRGEGLDSVQMYFAVAIAAFVMSLWVYHITSPNGLDRQSQLGLSLCHAALFIAAGFWAVLRFLPRARASSSTLQGVQVCMIIALFCWGLPATARETCSDVYNTFDCNLQQSIFVCICYAAVFCRVGASTFAMVCLVTLVNLCAAAPPTEL